MYYTFTICLADIEEMTDEIADRLYEAGCDDGTPFSGDGETSVGFDRNASSLEAAIASAIANVRAAGFIVKRAEVEPDDVLSVAATA